MSVTNTSSGESNAAFDSVSRSADPDAIMEALQGVIGDVDTFLSDWCHRIGQKVSERDRTAMPEDKLRRCIGEFQKEKSLWEAKRDAEEQRIEEKAAQLSEAWLRLEAEQRALLQMKDSHSGSRDRSAGPPEPQPSVSQPAARAECPMQCPMNNGAATQPAYQPNPQPHYSQPAPSPASASHYGGHVEEPSYYGNEAAHAPEPPSGSRESAVRQFQRLRKEIHSSRSNSGQA